MEVISSLHRPRWHHRPVRNRQTIQQVIEYDRRNVITLYSLVKSSFRFIYLYTYIIYLASPRGSRQGGPVDMAPPSMDQSQSNQGRRGSLRLQSRVIGQNGGMTAAGSVPSGLPQVNGNGGGGNSAMELSRPTPVTSARSSGLI